MLKDSLKIDYRSQASAFCIVIVIEEGRRMTLHNELYDTLIPLARAKKLFEKSVKALKGRNVIARGIAPGQL